ncbi:LacI family DNA-binding transcriptional regulator [Actinomycetaceae bacterium L2_0104]
MADIAAAASVAVSTVSRALSGSPGVSPSKRRQIIAIARKLGYLSNELSNESAVPAPARATAGTASLESGVQHMVTDQGGSHASKDVRITAVVPEADRWIFGSILTGIHDGLAPRGISLQVRQGLSASQRAQFLSSPRLSEQTDLVILVPAPRDMAVDDLVDLPIPAVIAGSLVEGVPSVGIDDVAVGQKAANYLRNLGLENIAYVGYMDHEGTSGVATHRRGIGYEDVMNRDGLPIRHLRVPFTPSPGRAAAEVVLAGENLPQGIICSSDEIAADMMAVFRKAGVSIPDDISIVGVDDHPLAEILGLTTIGQPAREQGREAARLALRILEPPIVSQAGNAERGSTVAVPESIALPTRLIVRQTTRRMER